MSGCVCGIMYFCLFVLFIPGKIKKIVHEVRLKESKVNKNALTFFLCLKTLSSHISEIPNWVFATESSRDITSNPERLS